MAKLGWGIIGAGGIAHLFAKSLARSHTGTLVAVGSRSPAKAEQFGAEFNVPHCYGSYDALLADPSVEVVYIAVPHPLHREWAVKAAQAGKHILVEKPIGMNAAEAQVMIDAAKRHDVFLMEGFMYRCHPQTARLVELIRQRVIGEVRVIQAVFSFQAGYDPAGRIYNKELGGGGILDVGCYCASIARLVAGVAAGGDFAEPEVVAGVAQIGEATGVDEYALASLRFPGGILAQLSCGIAVSQGQGLRIFGTEGSIHLPEPFTALPNGGTALISVHRHGEEPCEVFVQAEDGLFTIEADFVAAHIPDRQAPSPAMSWADTLGNMRTLDRWREEVGLRYDADLA